MGELRDQTYSLIICVNLRPLEGIISISHPESQIERHGIAIERLFRLDTTGFPNQPVTRRLAAIASLHQQVQFLFGPR